jgi:hypothetical protein
VTALGRDASLFGVFMLDQETRGIVWLVGNAVAFSIGLLAAWLQFKRGK